MTLSEPGFILFDRNHIPYAAQDILEHAEQFELFSLNPEYQRRPGILDFHGYRVLRQISIASLETRGQLISALERGVHENQGATALCFNPRHGIRAVRKGRTADFVICFECLQVQVTGEGAGGFLVSNSPKPVFDKVLREAHGPLQ
jgi:hypothetical protein